jgi:CheY-like chemotaxis protein
MEGVAEVPTDARTDGSATPAAFLTNGNGDTASEEPSIEDQLADEIDVLEHGDRVILVIDAKPERGKSMVEAVRTRGGKAILARRASAALGLAREHRPSAVLLAAEEPRFESVLGQLKKHPDTRHLPVALIGDGAVRVDALRAGAAAFVDDPVDPSGLETALDRLERLSQGPERRIALVADAAIDDAFADLLAGDANIEVERLAPADALEALRGGQFDLGVVAVGKPRSETFATRAPTRRCGSSR